ncbi:MAG: helix-turn-helix transcriptional regulator [Candidatus Binatia bacterium]
MAEIKAEASENVLENALSDLVRRAIRVEIQEIIKFIRQQDRLLTIDEVAQQLSVSKDWVYRHGKKLTFTKKLGPKMVRFSETGLQKWLKER